MSRRRHKSAEWILAHVGHEGEGCLIWPFSRSRGYPSLQYEGRTQKGHRVMCKLAHGEPPTPKHEAAHSCGKGHEGCINPRHLSWKTKSENQRDRRKHGTASAKGPRRYKLTLAQVEQIRALKGIKSLDEIAAMYGVTYSNISQIMTGTTWRKAA